MTILYFVVGVYALFVGGLWITTCVLNQEFHFHCLFVIVGIVYLMMAKHEFNRNERIRRESMRKQSEV